MSRNGGIVGFTIKWGAISAVVVGVLSYFGVVDLNDHRIKNKLNQAEQYVARLFGKAGDSVEDAVGDAKRTVKGTVNEAVNDAVDEVGDVVEDAADSAKDVAKDAAKDATRGAAGTVNDVKRELQ